MHSSFSKFNGSDVNGFYHILDIHGDKSRILQSKVSDFASKLGIISMESILIEHAGEDDLKDLSREIKILIHLGRHLNVINLLGACTRGKGNSVYALLEFCEHGSLQSFLRGKKEKFDPSIDEISGYFCGDHVTHFDLLTLIIQIVRGMLFLHANKVRMKLKPTFHIITV